MRDFQLTKTELRNLLASQQDLNVIDIEIERAKRAGVVIEPDLIASCEECRKGLYDILKTYSPKEERKVLK